MQIQIIENKILNYIKNNKLIEQNDEILVGVSGGADSMMLINYLEKNKKRFEISIKIAHINHKMRSDAELDIIFVKNFADQNKIKFEVLECDIKQLAKEHKLSLEEAGRLARYNFFNSLANENTKIATAHNANDQAETVLMRFLRGSDVLGLSGISPKRQNIIRPILCITREEVEFYCSYYNIEYRTDYTNNLEIYTRNKIRHSLIPYITKNINANIMHTLVEHSKLYSEEEDFLSSYTQKLYHELIIKNSQSYEIKVERLKKEKPYIQKKLISKVISELKKSSYNITTNHLNSAVSLLNNQSGKSINLSEGVKILKTQHSLVVYLVKEPSELLIKPLFIGTNEFKNYVIILNFVKEFSKNFPNIYTKYVDYDKIKSGLKVRSKIKGDKIKTHLGTKTLKKIFIDEKIPINLRENIPIIVDGDEVVCIFNSRLNADYYITDKTQKILEIKIILGGANV
ncbi:tRNA lysidine(34) synthetase TilS [Candidatus Epulonipiscioides gigas]|nr:tRNA lysidine(34) synthetase TilS [Epulopiscium sp. SCG-C07WGA-EpuloA2]